MATRTHKLATTDLQIRNAKPEDKKLIFGNGYLIVWRWFKLFPGHQSVG
jgi:hypothetical protein